MDIQALITLIAEKDDKVIEELYNIDKNILDNAADTLSFILIDKSQLNNSYLNEEFGHLLYDQDDTL